MSQIFDDGLIHLIIIIAVLEISWNRKLICARILKIRRGFYTMLLRRNNKSVSHWFGGNQRLLSLCCKMKVKRPNWCDEPHRYILQSPLISIWRDLLRRLLSFFITVWPGNFFSIFFFNSPTFSVVFCSCLKRFLDWIKLNLGKKSPSKWFKNELTCC